MKAPYIGIGISQPLNSRGFTPWTPAKLGSALDLWIDPSNTASMEIIGGRVQQINDLSGKGYNLTAPNGSARPVYTASDSNVNNMPTIKNENTTQTLNMANVPVLRNVAGASAFQIVRYDTGVTFINNSFSLRVSNGSSPTSARFGFSSNIVSSVDYLSTALRRLDADTFQNITGTTTKSNVAVLRSTVMNYGTALLNQWTNGSQDITNVTYGTPGNTSDTNSQIVSLMYGSPDPLIGITVGESILCNVALSIEDRQKVEGYLAWKWGMVASLPANHPYKYDGSLFVWTPSLAFKSADNGVWYDPSDFSTLFQDSAGTTPVTAVEQPVGLMLDKSKKETLGEQMLPNGTFDTDISGWIASASATIAWSSGKLRVTKATTGIFPRGSFSVTGLTVGKLYRISADISNPFARYAFISVNTGTNYNRTFSVSSNISFVLLATSTSHTIETGIWDNSGNVGDYIETDNFSVREIKNNHAIQPTATSRPILRARYNLLTATETLATQSATTVATTYRLLFSGAGTITLSGTATGTYTAGTHNITCTAGTLTLTVSGAVTQADLRPTNDALTQPPYQRVTTATNYDTVGFMPYLEADGVDDGMATANIDFTATDKLTICTGIRRLNATVSVPLELSANWVSNTGSFIIVSGLDAGFSGLNSGSRGSANADASQVAGVNLTAPVTSTLMITHDIGGSRTRFARNNIYSPDATGNKGTGNFGNYRLFLFRRGGTTLSFNGRMYGLVIVGKLLTATDLTNLENFINDKTKAY